MARITCRMGDGVAYVTSETGTEGVGHLTTQRRLPQIISKLAAYEDSGLTPEECTLYAKCEAHRVSKSELKLSNENEILRRSLSDLLKRGYSGDMCPHCVDFDLCNTTPTIREECLDGDSEGFELDINTLMKVTRNAR